MVERSYVTENLNHYTICPTCDKIILANKEHRIKKHFLDHFRKQIIGSIILSKNCKKCDKSFGHSEDIVSHYAIEHALLDDFIDDTFEINTIDTNFPDNIDDITKECKGLIIHYLNGGSLRPNYLNGKMMVDKRKVSVLPTTSKPVVGNGVFRKNPFVIEKPMNDVKSPPKITTNKPKNISNTTNSLSFKDFLDKRLGKESGNIENSRQTEIKRPKRERPAVNYDESLDVISQKVSRTGSRVRPVVNYDETSDDVTQNVRRTSISNSSVKYQCFNLDNIPSHFKYCQVSIEKLSKKIVDKHEIIPYEPELIDLIDSDSESDSDILEISDVLVDTRILTPVKSLCSDDSNDDSSTEDVSLFSKPLAQSSPIHSRCTSPINSDKTSSKVDPLLQTKISKTVHNNLDTNNDDPKNDENKMDKSHVEKDDDLENDKDNENKQVETENNSNEKVHEGIFSVNELENKPTENESHENVSETKDDSTEVNGDTSVEKLEESSDLQIDKNIEKEPYSDVQKEMTEKAAIVSENNLNQDDNEKPRKSIIIKFVDETKIEENDAADNDTVEDKLNDSCELLEDFSDLSFNTSVSDVIVQDNIHSDNEL